jgi:hypothetical protein
LVQLVGRQSAVYLAKNSTRTATTASGPRAAVVRPRNGRSVANIATTTIVAHSVAIVRFGASTADELADATANTAV